MKFKSDFLICKSVVLAWIKHILKITKTFLHKIYPLTFLTILCIKKCQTWIWTLLSEFISTIQIRFFESFFRHKADLFHLYSIWNLSHRFPCMSENKSSEIFSTKPSKSFRPGFLGKLMPLRVSGRSLAHSATRDGTLKRPRRPYITKSFKKKKFREGFGIL